ncbi:hypothetical protein FDP41_011504 [Naegleria fowleri]|uniref:Uncharacterized protein n=1 Tax=Naegleria fowleri TaxID=5763 RepID=A0A6A5C7V2_NAEFO|nr:uncharacterized protein FDP41_011504 [Naegleria fowleri]KAF0982574.1 hypothetical protein FDP41_011504 [Naegleria fowleri]
MSRYEHDTLLNINNSSSTTPSGNVGKAALTGTGISLFVIITATLAAAIAAAVLSGLIYQSVLFFTTHSFDVLNEIEKSTKVVNGTSFMLMGVKLFQKQRQGDQVTAKFLLTYIRSTPNTPPVVDPPHYWRGNAAQNYNANQFTIALANSGLKSSPQSLFVLYMNSAQKCCFSVVSYDNSTDRLSILNAFTEGPSGVDCKVGLTSFTYDASTVLLFELNSLAALKIDSKTGELSVKTKSTQNLIYRDILSSANPGAVFVGNDLDNDEERSTQFFALYTNKDSGYASLSKISWNGNDFDTFRLIPLRKVMKNPRLSFIETNKAQIFYEDSTRNMYRTAILTFTSEAEDTYTISTVVEGIHFALGTLSPSAWNVIVPNNCLMMSCIPLLQSPTV